MDPVTALAVMAGAAVGKAAFQVGAEHDKLEAIDLQRKQKRLEHQQKTLANYDLTERVLGSQLAEATTRGVALSSPSFEAIQRNTANVGSERQKNLNIEESIFERNAKIEKQNVKDSLFAQLFGDVTEIGLTAANVSSKMPSKVK